MMYNFVPGGAFMARKTTGSRMRLGDPLADQLTALCEVLPGRPTEIGIVREAVEVYIAASIASDRALKGRYENALKIQRGGTDGDNVVALPKGK